MAQIKTAEAAARFARTIISDIALYNREKILTGIKNDNLFEILEKELQEGLELYKTRVTEDLDKNYMFFNRAIVDILIKRSGNIESEIW